jgi:phosphatidylserine/phosphatidylglycerophosphate/cardiolipin synthase-like enzyme
MDIKYIENSDIYKAVVLDGILKAKKHVYIATANVKAMFVKPEEEYVSIVEALHGLCRKGVEIRLLHSSSPSEPFLRELSETGLRKMGRFMMVRCIRSHLKVVIIDGEKVYLGSANLSGAGMGAKRENRRNFEVGIISSDTSLVDRVSSFFKMIWNGEFCQDCGRRKNCPAKMDRGI